MEHSELVEELKNKADARNRYAMEELEARGFQFLVDFGYHNAAAKLQQLKDDDSIVADEWNS